ncbi:hypothetical protein HOY82DRAFT_326171 [Tuber indicum]|nr:hypothetical protein HOY82DRAFT_326171 [Tuber indicum]
MVSRSLVAFSLRGTEVAAIFTEVFPRGQEGYNLGSGRIGGRIWAPPSRDTRCFSCSMPKKSLGVANTGKVIEYSWQAL